MGRLIYFAMASLDGYIADSDGNFDWAAPDEEVHAFANELVRGVGTHLYGRRMYEVMSAWENLGGEDADAIERDFARSWRAAHKVVYSTTLPGVTTAKTRLERRFDIDAVREMKARESGDISIAGPTLAADALRADLVDEYQLIAVPYIAGGGTAWLPGDLRTRLELLDERRFECGSVFLRYRPVSR